MKFTLTEVGKQFGYHQINLKKGEHMQHHMYMIINNIYGNKH